MKIVAKSILYLFLELVLFVAIYSWGNILLGQVGEVDACMTPEYGEFELNYLAFGWSNYFHWFYSAEGQPCRFSGFGLCCVYFFSLPFYTLLKIYGAFKMPNKNNSFAVFNYGNHRLYVGLSWVSVLSY